MMSQNDFLYNNIFPITAISLSYAISTLASAISAYTVENEFTDLKNLVNPNHVDSTNLELFKNSEDELTTSCYDFLKELTSTKNFWIHEHRLDFAVISASAPLTSASKEIIQAFSIGEMENKTLRDSLINLRECAWEVIQINYILCRLFMRKEPRVLNRTEENAEGAFHQLIHHTHAYTKPLIILGMTLSEIFVEIEHMVDNRLLNPYNEFGELE